MADPQASSEAETDAPPAPRPNVGALLRHPIVTGVGGALLGAIIGLLVNWGWGAVTDAASLDDVMQEQRQSFDAIQAALGKLKAASPEELREIVGELRGQIGAQETYAKRYQAQLAAAEREVGQLRDQLLKEKDGYAGGAQFWLGGGESLRLPGEGNVLGLYGSRSTWASVTLGSASSRLYVGQSLPFTAAGRQCQVFLRQLRRPEDGRLGFDVQCTPPPGGEGGS